MISKVTLIDVPSDNVFEILRYLDVVDMANFGKTCKMVNQVFGFDKYWICWLKRDFKGYDVKYKVFFHDNKYMINWMGENKTYILKREEKHQSYKKIYQILYLGAKLNLDIWMSRNSMHPKACYWKNLFSHTRKLIKDFIQKFELDGSKEFINLCEILRNYRGIKVKLTCNERAHMLEGRCKSCKYNIKMLSYIGTLGKVIGFDDGAIFDGNGRTVERGIYKASSSFELENGFSYRKFSKEDKFETREYRLVYNGEWRFNLYHGNGILYHLNKEKSKNLIIKKGKFIDGKFDECDVVSLEK